MVKTVQQKKFRWQAHKPLLATALAVAGVFNMVGAVIAEGTDAGETISNTATATYTDDDGSVINATSNTVEILVAEVAGLTAVPVGITDTDDGAVEAGDVLLFDFEVTNTGNAETNVFVPGINGLNTNTTDNFDATTVEIIQINDGGTPDPSDDTVTVIQTIDPDGSLTTVPLPADGSIIVRVTGTPAAGTSAGQLVSVTLGDVTPESAANDNSASTQNQDFNANADNDDLFTSDSDGTLAPVNGQREASAQQDIGFASSVNPLALATALKTSTIANNDPSVTTDDRITYDLGLRVEDTDPSNVFQPAALVGTTLNVDGANEELILVSDAIPEGTVFESITTPVPASWTPVYSTVAPVGVDPLSAAASWSRTQPTDLSTIERVGFIRSGSLAPGFEQTGLLFTVRTSGLAATGGTVDNLAQVFGETSGVPDAVIYDESGDQSPNNNTPPTAGTNYPVSGDDGVADANNDGIDTANNNTGDPNDTNGEVNRRSIVPSADDILNGPANTPGAVGPTDDNDDFTNNSTPVPVGLEEGDLFDPSGDPVSFVNTVSNPTAGTLSNVTIEPIAPSQAVASDGATDLPDSQYGEDGDIPDGTIVTISYDDGVNPIQTAEYTYTSGAAEPFAITPGNTPVNVGDILPGAAPISYDVTVTLPNGTAVLDEIPIPIVAFADDDPTNNAGFTGEVTNNVTIDRVYTGFMRLVKSARILDAESNQRFPATPGDFSQNLSPDPLDPADPRRIAPGEYIEYKVDYLNISTDGTAGTGNVGMNANNFVLTEDGTGADAGSTANNWAGFTTHQQNTAATLGTIELTGGGTTYNADPSSGTVVDVYTNDVGTVLPQGSGSLTFRRLVD